MSGIELPSFLTKDRANGKSIFAGLTSVIESISNIFDLIVDKILGSWAIRSIAKAAGIVLPKVSAGQDTGGMAKKANETAMKNSTAGSKTTIVTPQTSGTGGQPAVAGNLGRASTTQTDIDGLMVSRGGG